MVKSTVYDCSVISLNKIQSNSGNITIVNNFIEIPFEAKRIYYLYDIPGGESRGGHGHRALHQLIIAGSGSFDVTLDDGRNKRTFNLARPNVGLFLPPGLWRNLDNFSSGSICLVLASQVYDERDYIRDYNEFKKYKNGQKG